MALEHEPGRRMVDIPDSILNEPQRRPLAPTATPTQIDSLGSLPGFGRISAELTVEDFKALGPEQQDKVIVDLMRGKAIDDKDPEVRRRNQEIDAKIMVFRPDFEMAHPISERERNDFQAFEELVNYDVRGGALAEPIDKHNRRLELIAFRQKIGEEGRRALSAESTRRKTDFQYTFPRPVFNYGDMIFKMGRFDRRRLEEQTIRAESPKELQKVA